MRMLDDAGAAMERQVDKAELMFGRSALGSFVLGALLALGAIGGGITTFLVVFTVLVKVFA
jgi:hypothetical protein